MPNDVEIIKSRDSSKPLGLIDGFRRHSHVFFNYVAQIRDTLLIL